MQYTVCTWMKTPMLLTGACLCEPAVVLHVLQTVPVTLCVLLQQMFNTRTPKVLLEIPAFCLQMPILHWIVWQGQ